ncbi:hypothetical protein E2C01_082990 [Portunus trituberculatus]|uniref:Uncharacterized protein n=1 Tax=Portunus trituberculatus TaxID=210409 RepID=A0A5B7J583_PORTR|nr:hypothetical protein [Portunus trituberculatus]
MQRFIPNKILAFSPSFPQHPHSLPRPSPFPLLAARDTHVNRRKTGITLGQFPSCGHGATLKQESHPPLDEKENEIAAAALPSPPHENTHAHHIYWNIQRNSVLLRIT